MRECSLQSCGSLVPGCCWAGVVVVAVVGTWASLISKSHEAITLCLGWLLLLLLGCAGPKYGATNQLFVRPLTAAAAPSPQSTRDGNEPLRRFKFHNHWDPVESHGIISSPLMTQGGQPCKQQNSAQGGPPCAAYLLRRAVRPPNSKMVRRADRPVHHIIYARRSNLLTAKWCAGRTTLCFI